MRSALAVLVLILGTAVIGHAQPQPQPQAQTPTGVPTGRPITLDEAISIALEGQPDIQARLADYRAARFRVDNALAPLLPQLTGSGTTTRSSQTFLPQTATATQTITVERDFNQTFSAQVAVSQVLFDFGKNFAAIDVARKNADVALEQIELQRQTITQAVKESYTTMNFNRRLIRVNEQALQRAELNLRSARGFFEVGTRPKSDVTRAEVDVANANVDLIRARNAERLARVLLNTSMGIAADAPTDVIDNLAYTPITVDRVKLQQEAIKQRPEYRQSKLRVDGADAFVRQRFREFFPDITGQAAYGGVQTDLKESWSATLNFTWPLFDGGGRIARYREARALVDSARASLRSQALSIERDVEGQIITVVEAQERIQAAGKAVESAQENFRLAQGRFDAGVGTILELTDAQLALTQAQNTEAQALQDFQVNLARLDRATGRR